MGGLAANNARIEARNRRILVVDDNPAIHLDYQKILTSDDEDGDLDSTLVQLLGDKPDTARASFELDSAYQGEEGLEMVCAAKAAGRPYALAFVDMRMPPGWDGLETAEQMWKVSPGLQIVICTAFSDYSWKDVSQRIGQTDNLLVLKKPFDVIEVQQLATALTRKWAIAEDVIETRTSLYETIDDLCRLNQELEARNEELADFTFMASHDLQEPLSKLVSFSQLLEEDVGDDLSSDARADLEHITTAARRMKNLLSDLLVLSEARKSSMKLEWLDLRACFQGALEDLRGLVQGSGAAIEWDELPLIRGDERLIRQALGSLLANAIKYAKMGVAPQVKITCTEQDGELIVGVLDNGIGIDAQYAEHIFAPFKRLHARAEFSGTGIGLAICRKIVERHEGRVWVESGEGGGAHFKLQFKPQNVRMSEPSSLN